MSGLLELIVRRRRASASSRLGPPEQNGAPRVGAASYAITDPTANGAPGTSEVPAASQEPESSSDPRPNEGPRANGGPPPQSPDGAASEQSLLSESGDQRVTLVWPPPSTRTEIEAPAQNEAPAPDETPAASVAPARDETRAGTEAAAPAEDEAPARDENPAEPQPLEVPAPIPAPPEAPEQTGEPLQPGFLARGQLRRRARYLCRIREIQLRDIGGFVLELHRFGRDRPDLVQAKVAGAARTDRELRALERALGGGQHESLRELREAGVGGACERCGAVHGSGDRFCSFCGASLSSRVDPDDPPSADRPSDDASTDDPPSDDPPEHASAGREGATR